MATVDTSPADNGYGNPYLDSLIYGNRWSGNVTYSFGTVSGQTWTATEKQAFKNAFDAWSAVCNITFSEDTSGAATNLTETEATSATWNDPSDRITLADHWIVGTGPDGEHTVGRYNTNHPSWSDLTVGGMGFSTIVHELGHAIGLDHPHDAAELFPGVERGNAFGDTGDNGQNQAIWTIMSYNRGWNGQSGTTNANGHAMGPMAFDIAAVQELYGINWSTNAGDNVYSLPSANASGIGWRCIWDGGGNDTISNAGGSGACTIDLRAAPLTGANAGGYVSWVGGVAGGFTIANKAVIENAIGGSAADTITGNDADNVLEGGGGGDTIDGGAGRDTASYASSNAGVDVDLTRANLATTDTNYRAPTGGHAAGDRLISIENLIGSNFDDRLVAYGDATGSKIDAGKGNDTIFAQGGNDLVRGGMGNDTITDTQGNDIIYGGDGNLVVNGGFEVVANPTVGANGYVSAVSQIDGWTRTGGPGVELFTNGDAGAPSEGRYGLDMEGVGNDTNVTITQQLTRAEDGVLYRLAFDARKLSGSGARLEVEWGGQKITFTAADGSVVPYLDPTTSTLIYYIDLVGGAGTGQDKNRLTFREIGSDADANGTLLDNVRMYRVKAGTAKADDNDTSADGNDSFTLGTGSDTVFGDGGNDVATFSDTAGGMDSFDGGSGDDDLLVMDWTNASGGITYTTFGSTNSATIGGAESFRIFTTGQYLFFKEVERFNLKGGASGDTLRGGERNDILIGNGGDDTLIGGGGIDDFNGGQGFDRAVVSLSGGNNTIVLKNAQGSGSVTLSNGTKLTSIESISLEAGTGDDFLDVRGTIVNAPGIASTDLANFNRTSTRFDGEGGNDTLAVDLATSYDATFDGGTNTAAGDLLIMDWSRASSDVVRDQYGSYQSLSHAVTVNNVTTYYYFTMTFTNVERFDLTGGTANDTLFGASGDDRITTIGGRDTATLGDGNDTLAVDWSTVDYSVVTSSFAATSGATGYTSSYYKDPYDNGNHVDFSGADRFELKTGSGADRLRTGDGDDSVTTNGGDDWLATGKGADTVDGGAGGMDAWSADKLNMSGALVLDLNLTGVQGSYVVGGKTATISGIDALGYFGSGLTTAERFQSGSGNDVIKTSRADGYDYLDTGIGNDTVTIYDGRDDIDMGVGNDTLIVDWAVLDFDYSIFTDGLTGSLAAGYSGTFYKDPYDNGNRVAFKGVEHFVVTTDDGDDRIATGDGNDTVKTNGGADWLHTGKGGDTVEGGVGMDAWSADKADLTIGLTLDLNNTDVQGSYTLGGKAATVKGIDALGYRDGSGTIYLFKTGSGADVITTSRLDGYDYLDTGLGNDTVTIYDGRDEIAMGGGTDTLVVDWSTLEYSYSIFTYNLVGSLAAGYSGVYYKDPYDNGNRVAFSGVEHFEITTSDGADRIGTGDGNDTVKTGAGDDWLDTGKGGDTVDGGTGGMDAWSADKSALTVGLTLDLNSTAIQGSYTLAAKGATVQGIDALGYRDNAGTTYLFKTGSGNDDIKTSKLDGYDYLDTGFGNDKVTIYDGRDEIAMGAGSDTLVVDWSTLEYEYSIFTANFAGSFAAGYSGSFYKEPYDNGNRVIFSGVEQFDITTSTAGDFIVTGDGDDKVTSNAGDDTLFTGLGADVIDGGLGDADRWQADKSNATAGFTIDLNLAGIQGSYAVGGKAGTVSGIESLGNLDTNPDPDVVQYFQTSSFDDVIVTRGSFLADYISTNGGADRVTVAGGRDIVALGGQAAGTVDTLVVNWASVDYAVFTGSFNAATADGHSGFYYKEPYDNGNRVEFTGVERFEVTTGSAGDWIFTGDGNDSVTTNLGNDWMNTGKGADTVDGGAGELDAWAADKTAMTAALVLDLNAAGVQGTYTIGGATATVRNIDALGYRDGNGVTLFKSGSGDDVIATSRVDGNDYLDTGAGNDTVTIFDGRDEIAMGAGSDTLVVDWSVLDADYSIFTSGPTGSLATGYSGVFYKEPYDNGNRVAFSGVEHFVVTTDDAGDRIVTGDGNDTLKSNGGDDTLFSDKGADIIDGGTGIDSWTADKSDLAVALSIDLTRTDVQSTYAFGGKTATVRNVESLGASADTTFLTGSGNDVIVTRSEGYNDFIATKAGADTVTVAGGRDYVDLGANAAGTSDTLIVNYSAMTDAVRTSGGAPTLTAEGYSGTFFKEPYDNGNRVEFKGVERFVVTTGSAEDWITTGDGADTLNGGGGNDILTGAGGNDTYVVDSAADQVIEAAAGGTDTVQASVSYTLAANQEIEVLATILDTATTVIDLTGNAGANTLRGNAGKNVLDGGAGIDQLYGLAGNDTYLVDDVSDRVFEAANGGTDTVKVAASIARYTLLAGQQVEALVAADAAGTTVMGLVGNEFGQSIIGNAGNNVIKGGGGNDTINGSSGVDTADYSDKTVSVEVTLSGAVAATVKVGGVAEDTVVKIENVTGGSAADTLTGDGGANVLDGGAGNDILTGMAGSDTYLVDSASDQVFEAVGGGTDTVKTSVSYTLAAGQEIEVLRTLVDTATTLINLTGNERNNTLRGNAADNLLDGGAGIDQLYGLAGNDTYLVDNISDRVFEAANGGTLDIVKVAASVGRYALVAAQQVEALVAADAASTVALNLTGNEWGQAITGNAGVNILKGGLGADTLNGGAGIDTADYSDKTTAVEVTLNGSVAATVKVGGVAEDTLVNIENLTGGAGADKLTGDSGANVLDGGKGVDVLTGLGGNDTYLVDSASDQVIEAAGGGTDTVKASVSYTLATNQEIEALFTTNDAGTDAINLTGNALGQAITGNAGVNILTGGGGVDRMTGGLGNDVFAFKAVSDTGATATTRDVILDFTQGQDRIDLSAIDANGAAAGDTFTFVPTKNAAFTKVAGQLVFAQEDLSGTANDRTIVSGDIDGNGAADFQIELTGLVNLTASDFVL